MVIEKNLSFEIYNCRNQLMIMVYSFYREKNALAKIIIKESCKIEGEM